MNDMKHYIYKYTYTSQSTTYRDNVVCICKVTYIFVLRHWSQVNVYKHDKIYHFNMSVLQIKQVYSNSICIILSSFAQFDLQD